MRCLAAAVLLLTACGGSSGDGDRDAPAGVDASTPAAFDDGVARVEVQSRDFGNGQGATSITAMLIDAPAPWPYEPAVTDGSCRMWRRLPPEACDPQCEFDQACIGGACVTAPVSGSAGTLTVTGDGVSEQVPFEQGFYGRYLQVARWSAGTELTASAPGAELGGFTASARLPAPFALRDPLELRLAPGVPLTLRWTADGGDARVRVNLGADQGHGRYRTVVIECDVADADGGVTIPQAMVDELADRDNWSCGDCFSHEVRRYRRGDTTIGATTLTLWAVQLESLYLVPDVL